MVANEACPAGKEITSVDRCKEAASWASSLGLNPTRPFQNGSWPGVPFQCSVQLIPLGQSSGLSDDTFHFSDFQQTDNARFLTGEFVKICEKGGQKIIFCTGKPHSGVNFTGYNFS